MRVILRKCVVGDILPTNGWERYKAIIIAIAIVHYRKLSYVVLEEGKI